MAEQLAQAQRDPAAVETSAGGPGSRSKASTVGRLGALAPARARGAARAPPAAPSRPGSAGRRRRRSRSRRRSADSTGAVSTQSGRCLGQRFSKKAASVSSTPSGKRRRVSGRPGEVGDHRRRDLGVVVDHLALGEAGLRVEHLVEVGELQLGARRRRLRGFGHWLLRRISTLARAAWSVFERRLVLRRRGRFAPCLAPLALASSLLRPLASRLPCDRGDALLQRRHQVRRLGRPRAPRLRARRRPPRRRPCARSAPAAPRGTRRGRRSGSKLRVSESISCSAISTSRLATFGFVGGQHVVELGRRHDLVGEAHRGQGQDAVRRRGSPPGAPGCGRRSGRSPPCPSPPSPGPAASRPSRRPRPGRGSRGCRSRSGRSRRSRRSPGPRSPASSSGRARRARPWSSARSGRGRSRRP